MRIPNLFTKLTLFWLIFFAFGRLLSVFYQLEYIGDTSRFEILRIFLYAIRLDLGAAAMLLVIPYLAWVVFEMTGFRKPMLLMHFVNIVTIIIVAALFTADLELVREWGAKVNFRAISYLAYPQEAFASVYSSPLALLAFIVSFLGAAGIFLYNRLIMRTTFERTFSWPSRLIFIPLIPIILFVLIRGGFQQIPINSSTAYFSSNRISNMIAVNPGWALVESVYAASFVRENPYSFLPNDQAIKEVKALYSASKGNHTHILTHPKPNIVILILESWTADVIRPLGGDPSTTPNFEKLSKEGLLFEKFYASGMRSNQGLISILSGFPAMSTAIHDTHRMQTLPCLAQELEKVGYSTSFLYGGDLNFSNFRAYLTFCGFDRLIGKEDFPVSVTRDKWGAHDEYTLDKQIELLNQQKEPFFSALFTLSSHEPFTVPRETPFKGESLADQFRSAVSYSDYSLGQYFEKAKKQSWYENTIFILVADHGHRLPFLRPDGISERFHIPLLIVGGPLKSTLRGSRNSKLGSQVDIVSTLLSELELSSKPFHWSKDLLTDNPNSFAYYSFDDGFGMFQESNLVIFDNRTERWIHMNKTGIHQSQGREPLEESTLGKAMMQRIYQDFLDQE